MYWYMWWGISAIIFIIAILDAILLSKLRYKRKRILTPNKMLILGTFLSTTILLCPIYLKSFSDSVGWVEWGKSILLSMQHAVRLFAFEGNFMEFFNADTIAGLTPMVQMLYTGASAVLYAFAPLLTFGLILSFFKNASAYRKYVFSFWKHTHVFSELNERSLALAKSIDEKYNKKGEGKKRRYRIIWRKALIVFTDVINKDEEENLELIEEAKEIGAILFTKDLESIRYRKRYLSVRKVNFYLISDDEEEKIHHAESIIRDYRNINITKLYLFSNNIESKCFLDSYTNADKEGMLLEVIRVNDIRALVYHNLHDNGIKLFENANKLTDGTREISAVIVGLGQYGMEMIKALLWYCQLPGYRVKITAFDEQEISKSIFRATCPDILLDEKVDTEGDMRYTLSIQNAKFGTEDFYKAIQNISDVSYLFVCLGNDNQNISAATGIRNWLAKENQYPEIETVVYDSSLKERICADFEKQKIGIIGDLNAFYSEGTVIDSKLADSGLDVHKRWDGSENAKNNFYMNDYNYYSSLASALHRNLRKNIITYNNVNEVFPFYGKYDGAAKELFQSLNDNEKIKALSKEMTSFADYLYIKLAHIHYMRLSIDERRKVLEALQDYMREKGICIDIPMLNDVTGCSHGYDTYIQDIGNDAQKRKALRRIFDLIINVKTKKEKDETQKRNIIHSLEYASLSNEEKKLVCEYVKQQLQKSNEATFNMDTYFEKGRCFAKVEHIRWNAYMRTEGFRCAIETNKKYKLHYDLVPVDQLTFADCIKDI